MERVLHIYSLVYDMLYPVVCFDEKPCALYADITEPIAPEPCQRDEQDNIKKRGRPKKIDAEYERHGSCSVLVAVEPLTGWRMVKTCKNRKSVDFAQFMKELAAKYPNAIKIRVVLDNLNTHTENSFYNLLSAEEAFELGQKFQFVYTPVKGSWLNMAEIELSALSRICLDRRLDSIEKLDKEIQQLVKERNENKVKIKWQFTKEMAREKLNRHYTKVNILNQKDEI
jgi:DDE superfamily endonuclease